MDQNKFLITIPNADTINHVVVFLTGLVQLPAQTAGCIFFSLPDPNAAPTWHYLGSLSNEKPSAIYRLSNITQTSSSGPGKPPAGLQTDTNNALVFSYAQAPVIHVAQIGISVEPLEQVQQMVPAVETIASKASSFSEFITKTVGNLYNYCSSFARPLNELMYAQNNNNNNGVGPFGQSITVGQRPITSSTQLVPLSVLQDWYENYTRRLGNDQNFWKTL